MKSIFPFIWIDLEMTGLDVKKDHIIEVAAIVTDNNLESVEEYHTVVFQPKEIIDKMDEWCKKTHRESGLVKDIPKGKRLEEVEKELIALIDRNFKSNERIIIAGNSIGNDKKFIEYHMPNLDSRLHYRVLDVTSIKIIYQYFFKHRYEKKNSHRAINDIYESINELKEYLSLMNSPKKDPFE